MDEPEWFAGADPDRLLEFVRPTVSDRKLRLFAAACCRRLWDWMGPGCRRAVEVLERWVDGEAAEGNLRQAAGSAYQEWLQEWGTHHPSNAACCIVGDGSAGPGPGTVLEAARAAAFEAALAAGAKARVDTAIALGYPDPVRLPPLFGPDTTACRRAGDQAQAGERAVQCQILRDIFHGPCPPVFLRRVWLQGSDHAAGRLADTIYRERAFDLLPILADSLEEGGCDDLQVLSHCRSGGLHVRGCWLIDGLLARW